MDKKKGALRGAFFMQRMQASLAFCERHDFIAEGIGTAAQGCDQFALLVDQELGEVLTHLVVS